MKQTNNIRTALVLVMVSLSVEGCSGPGWPMFSRPPVCHQPPAPVIEAPTPVSSGYLQAGPAIHGQLVVPPLQPTATERVVELSDKVVALNSDVVRLRKRIGSLELELAQRDKSIQAAREQFQLAQAELKGYRVRFQEWEAEAKRLETRIEQWNRRHREAIQSLADRLAGLIQTYDSAGSSREATLEPVAPQDAKLSDLPHLGHGELMGG